MQALLAFFPGWRRWLGPLLIVAAGFFLRVAYYDQNYGHPDEPIAVEVVGHMRSSGDWDTNWAKANLEPSLRYDQYNFSSHHYATFFFYRAVKLIPGLEAWRSRDNGFWVYRFFVALLATVAVWQTWSLARRIAGEAAGIAAGLLVGAMPLLVQDAHYIRPEAFVTTLTLAVVAMSWPRERYAAWRVAVAAVLVGLLLACKISLLALAWLPLVPAFVGGLTRSRQTGVRLGVAAALTLLGIAGGFVLGAPGAVLHPQAFWNGVHYLTSQYAGLHPPHSHVEGGPVADMLGGYFRSTLGLPALAAGLAGLAWLLMKRRWAEAALITGPVVLFVGYFCTRSVFFERNLSHVVPLFCVLAGVGVAEAGRGAGARWGGRVVLATSLFVVLTVVRPLELSRRLVFGEFSGREAARHDIFESGIRLAHPEMAWWIEAILNPEPINRMVAHFERGGKPFLLRAIDYHDEWSRRYGADLPSRLDVEQIAVYGSTFSDVTGCTLHTYGRWTDRYYVVRGVRKP